MFPGDDDGDDTGSFNLEAELLKGANGQESGGDDGDEPEVKEKPLSLRSTLSRGEVTIDEDEEPGEEFPEPPSDSDDEGDETPEEETETPPAAGDATEQSVLDIFAEAKAQGYDLGSKYKTPKDALIGLLNATRLVGQRNQLAAYGERLVNDPIGVYNEMKARIEPVLQQQAPAKQPEPPKAGSLPEYNPEWVDAFDNEGRLLPNADPTIPAKIEKYTKALQERVRKMAHDPVGELLPLMEKQIEAKAQAKAAELLDQYRYQQLAERQQAEIMDTAQRLIEEESSWIYVDGDRSKGPSEQGKVFAKWLQIVETPDHTGEPPIRDLHMRKEFAKSMAQKELGQLTNANAAPERQAQQKKIAKKPSRSAKEPTDKSWPAGLSLEEALARALDK